MKEFKEHQETPELLQEENAAESFDEGCEVLLEHYNELIREEQCCPGSLE